MKPPSDSLNAGTSSKQFLAIVRKHAEKLVDQFSFEKDYFYEDKYGYGILVTYQNDRAALRFCLEPREDLVRVHIIRLVKSEIPPYPMVVNKQTKINWFNVAFLVHIRGNSWSGQASSPKEVDTVVDFVCRFLIKEASDILNGDFTSLKEVEKLIKSQKGPAGPVVIRPKAKA